MRFIDCAVEYKKETDRWDFYIRVRSESFTRTIEALRRVLEEVL